MTILFIYIFYLYQIKSYLTLSSITLLETMWLDHYALPPKLILGGLSQWQTTNCYL
jgi:hypothetical protein